MTATTPSMVNTDLLEAYKRQQAEAKLPTVTMQHGAEALAVPLDPVFAALIPVLPIVSRLFASDAEPGDTVNSRELHAALEIGRDHATWITSTIRSMSLVEGVHYVMVKADPSNRENWPEIMKSGGRVRKDYFLSLNTAQHIAARLDNEKGYQVREYLFAVTKAFQRTIEKQFKKRLEDADKALAHQKSLVDRNEAVTLEVVKRLGAPSISAFEQGLVKEGIIARIRHEAAQHASAALYFWEMTSRARRATRSKDRDDILDSIQEKYGEYSDLARDEPPWLG